LENILFLYFKNTHQVLNRPIQLPNNNEITITNVKEKLETKAVILGCKEVGLGKSK